MNSKVVYTMIDGKKYGLLYNIAATRRIGEISGFKSALEWISLDANGVDDADDMAKITMSDNLAYKTCVILEALVNGYAEYVKATGGKAEFIPENFFINTLCSADALKQQENIVNAIKKGMEIEIPKDLAKDIDEDFVEIEAAKKN